MITIEKLSKSYGRLPVLRSVSLDLRREGITAVLGPNGSGKTTLLKTILGMVISDEGEIRVDGVPTRGAHAFRQQISYLPQIARFPENLSPEELLRMVMDLRGRPVDPSRLIELFGLGPHMKKRLGHLSGGTRQKVNIVQAFMYDNPVIILDEPTAGLDPVALMQFKELLRAEQQKGKHLLLTTHIMPLVEELADHLVFLLDGEVHFEGSVPGLLEKCRTDMLESAIAILLRSARHPVRQPANKQAFAWRRIAV